MSKEQQEIERLNYIGRLNNYIWSLECEIQEHSVNIEFVNKQIAVLKRTLQVNLKQKQLAKEALEISKKRLKEEQL